MNKENRSALSGVFYLSVVHKSIKLYNANCMHFGCMHLAESFKHMYSNVQTIFTQYIDVKLKRTYNNTACSETTVSAGAWHALAMLLS